MPHDLFCYGQVLALKNSSDPRNIPLFQKYLHKGNAVVVQGVHRDRDNELWHPSSFSKHFGKMGGGDTVAVFREP